jgi:hypothetical protein
MFQHLFHRHKTPQPRFGQLVFLLLIGVFVIILQSRPVLGLTGLGTTLVIAAALVELNAERIWTDYKKVYKKSKGWRGRFTAPDPRYYQLNVYFLWPFIGLLGIVALWAAYLYAA